MNLHQLVHVIDIQQRTEEISNTKDDILKNIIQSEMKPKRNNYEKEKENLCTMMQVCNQIQNNKGQLGTQN